MDCASFLKELIQQKGDLLFVDYMQQALYSPYGYYNSPLKKLGKEGDYISAPELTPFFAHALALQCQEILSQMSQGVICEFGAGTGKLCGDLLLKLEELNTLPTQYYILEVSGDLVKQQKNHINQTIPHLAHKIKWLQKWPAQSFNGIILANEVLDAMPVHRFLQSSHGILESYVSLNEAEEFIEIFKPCHNQSLLEYIEKNLSPKLIPYLSEANLFIEAWLDECFNCLNQGVALFIDYGFANSEYYHPDRHMGTLMCHYQHRAHTNPLSSPGQQDITAHVNFSVVADAAIKAGFDLAGYTTQASFLLANGLLSFISGINNEREQINATQAVKTLILPHEMGEIFKVIAFAKNYNSRLQGFSLADKRVSLNEKIFDYD